MENFLRLLWMSALPAAGNFLGSVLAELVPMTARRLSLTLHAAAGILLAVVAVELMPEALRQAPPWIVITSFTAGGLVFIALDHFLENIRTRAGKSSRSGPWTIYASVAIDLISDGIMIGVGSVVSERLALVLARAGTGGRSPSTRHHGAASRADIARTQDRTCSIAYRTAICGVDIRLLRSARSFTSGAIRRAWLHGGLAHNIGGGGNHSTGTRAWRISRCRSCFRDRICGLHCVNELSVVAQAAP